MPLLLLLLLYYNYITILLLLLLLLLLLYYYYYCYTAAAAAAAAAAIATPQEDKRCGRKRPTINEAKDAGGSDTSSGEGDYPDGWEEVVAEVIGCDDSTADAKGSDEGKRVDANGKALSRAHHSAALRSDGSRVGPARDLPREEVDALREEAQLAKESGIARQGRGPFIKPGEKPGFWRGQAWRAGHMGGGKRFGNRGGKNREYFTKKFRRGKLKPTPGKGHPGYAASAAWHKDHAGKWW